MDTKPTPPMETVVAQAILASAGTTPTAKLNPTSATRIIHAWLKIQGLSPDRWGNYVYAEGARRYHFGTRVFNIQRKSCGTWNNLSSRPLIDTALNLLVKAAEATGDATLADILQGKKAARKDASQKRLQKAEQEQQTQLASMTAAKQVACEFPSKIKEWILQGKVEIEKAKEINFRQDWLTKEFESRLQQGFPLPADGAYADAEHFPILPLLFPRAEYRYIVEQEGVHYTVTIRCPDKNVLEVMIGSGGGFLTIDPLTHGVRMEAGREGDGFLSGKILRGEGTLLASIFAIVANAGKNPDGTTIHTGAGSRLMKVWVRALRSLEIKWFMGEAIGPEGMGFFARLCAKGVLIPLRWQGSNFAFALPPNGLEKL